MTDDEVKRFQKLIEGRLKEVLTRHYPEYISNYMSFRVRVGPQCPLCKATAKTIFNMESRRVPDFMLRWREDNWNNYE